MSVPSVLSFSSGVLPRLLGAPVHLLQVVGSKYVALFLPSESANLYPSPLTMMENTSRVDLDNPDLDAFPDLSKLQVPPAHLPTCTCTCTHS